MISHCRPCHWPKGPRVDAIAKLNVTALARVPPPWHSRVGGGAVHSIIIGHSAARAFDASLAYRNPFMEFGKVAYQEWNGSVLIMATLVESILSEPNVITDDHARSDRKLLRRDIQLFEFNPAFPHFA